MKIELSEATQVDSERNQRRGERFTGTGGRVMLQTDDGRRFNGVVVNESFGGVGIVFDEPLPVQNPSEIDVAYHGVPTKAIVRHVTAFSKGGCMIGVHWKASAIAEQSEALVKLCERRDLQIPDTLARFIELLPGGVQLMLRLHENQRWVELSEAIDRLAQDAAATGIRGTDECLTVLMELLEDAPDATAIRKGLDMLIEQFIQKTTEIALTHKA
jgi:hypothetical protein